MKVKKHILVLCITTALLFLVGCACEHEWVEATCTEPKTCNKCGEIEGEPLEHDWKAATCTEPRTCTRCGATMGRALGHDWMNATLSTPETCSRCGHTTGDTIEETAVAYIISDLKLRLINPDSLITHGYSYDYIEGDRFIYFYITLDYAAMNGFGGYTMDDQTWYMKVDKVTNTAYESSWEEYHGGWEKTEANYKT